MTKLHDGPLATAKWLQQQMGDPALRIVDCRFTLGKPDAGRAHYDAGHIPGAIYLDLERDLSGPLGPTTERGPRGGRHPLPDPAVLAERLGALGIGDGTTVVAYDDSGGLFAARLWWLLQWLGHEDVRVLDGGLRSWLNEPLPLEPGAPSPTPRRPLTVRLRPQLMATAHDVGSRGAQTVLMDSRARARFDGHHEPIDPVAGHIPGAVCFDWAECLQADGRFASPQQQAARFAAVPRDAEIIVYCGSGVSAAANLLALRRAGYSTLRLYAGSWSDWISDPSNPCE
jgi:thiosulfate/3-mercaptopyruvate sulfurtransferase